MRSIVLIVEDGTEYRDFFELFLQNEHIYLHAQSASGAVQLLEEKKVDCVVLDMRFERSPAEDLIGDVEEVAGQYFGGDLARAHRFVEENQGTLILAEMRRQNHHQPILFVTDMPARKLQNLRDLYGQVAAVPTFDARAIRDALRKLIGADS